VVSAGSRTRAAAAIACLALALALAAPPAMAQEPDAVQAGRTLFLEACATCHGDDARGLPGQAPSLRGAGAQAADFYLSTGRMPLADPHDTPVRAPPAYSAAEREALVAYVGSLGGPPIPEIAPQRGSLDEGFALFTSHCSGCHQAVARGGVVPDAVAPPLQEATARQIAEAVRTGPYVMPAFPENQIDRAQLDSLVRYVLSTRSPPDHGGWGLGNLGPVPEGMVAWLLAGAAILLLAGALGERLKSRGDR
jgi:ubiquinol-cytochrome c reductase cytochrome c subunit